MQIVRKNRTNLHYIPSNFLTFLLISHDRPRKSADDGAIASNNPVEVLFADVGCVRFWRGAEKPKKTSSKPVSSWNWFRTRCKPPCSDHVCPPVGLLVKQTAARFARNCRRLSCTSFKHIHLEPRSGRVTLDLRNSMENARDRKELTCRADGCVPVCANRTSKPFHSKWKLVAGLTSFWGELLRRQYFLIGIRRLMKSRKHAVPRMFKLYLSNCTYVIDRGYVIGKHDYIYLQVGLRPLDILIKIYIFSCQVEIKIRRIASRK